MALTLMYITNHPEVAAIAQSCGVDRVWVDLEVLGKQERQGHVDSVKSRHTIADIRRLRPVVRESELLVRINPMNPDSPEEIDAVIGAGADIIMLPMWKTPQEVARFLALVGGRVKTTLLLETREAAQCLDAVLEQGGFDEIHIGLNDLHLSYGLEFMFELLSNGTVEALCEKIRKYGIPYGFGGIARLDAGLLPASRVVMEHYRLGSTRAILSRSFCDASADPGCEPLFRAEMARLREYEKTMAQVSQEAFGENKRLVAAAVNEIVEKRRAKN